MHQEEIEYRIVQEWEPGEIIDLYRSAGWWEEWYDPDGIQPLITGSAIFMVGVSSTGKAVAMGRILSDHLQTGYIQDLCVQANLRGRQIGTSLLRELVRAAEQAGLTRLHLVAEPDTHIFYQKADFISEDNLTFLVKTSGGTHEN